MSCHCRKCQLRNHRCRRRVYLSSTVVSIFIFQLIFFYKFSYQQLEDFGSSNPILSKIFQKPLSHLDLRCLSLIDKPSNVLNSKHMDNYFTESHLLSDEEVAWLLQWAPSTFHHPGEAFQQLKIESVNDSYPLQDDVDISSVLVPFSIHVFAWRRSHSLQRLLESLLSSTTLQQTVMGVSTPENTVSINFPLHFHVDADPLPQVLTLIEEIPWLMGPKTVKVQKVHQGLPKSIMSSWIPGSNEEFALFLEDDVALSPLWFDYVQWCLKRFLRSSQKEKWKRKLGKDRLLGCALYTPRVDELSPTSDPQHPPLWSPRNVTERLSTSFQSIIGQNLEDPYPIVLQQLPCSWGAVWSSQLWQSFQDYYKKRLPLQNFPKVPLVRSSQWHSSWKKFLIEFMYAQGLFMVYPNFLNQKAFSTNFYEEGVHSVINAADIKVPDVLRETVDVRFTIPLLQPKDELQVWKTLEALSEHLYTYNLDALPMISLFHNLTTLSEIDRWATEYTKLMKQYIGD